MFFHVVVYETKKNFLCTLTLVLFNIFHTSFFIEYKPMEKHTNKLYLTNNRIGRKSETEILKWY